MRSGHSANSCGVSEWIQLGPNTLLSHRNPTAKFSQGQPSPRGRSSQSVTLGRAGLAALGRLQVAAVLSVSSGTFSVSFLLLPSPS